jgi:hypothetical protein
LHINGKEFVEKANQETVVLAHVETRASVTNVRQILGNAGVDIVFLGMYDLTVSYGYPGEFKHANVTAAVEEIIAAAREYEKAKGAERGAHLICFPEIALQGYCTDESVVRTLAEPIDATYTVLAGVSHHLGKCATDCFSHSTDAGWEIQASDAGKTWGRTRIVQEREEWMRDGPGSKCATMEIMECTIRAFFGS